MKRARGRAAAALPCLLVLGVLALLAPWRFPLSSDGLLMHRTAEALAFEGTFRLPPAGPGARLDPFYFREVPGGVAALYPPLVPLARAALLSAASLLPEGNTRGRGADLLLALLPLLLTAAATIPLERMCRLGGLGKTRAPWLAAAIVLGTFLGPLGASDGHEPPLLFLLSLALSLALSAGRFRARRGEALAAGAGAAAGLALLAKPTAWVMLPALALAAFPRDGARARRRLMLLAAGFLPGLAAMLALNAARYGDALESGYSGPLAHPLARAAPLAWTLLRLTLLPNRGLLFFAPLLLLALATLPALRRPSRRRGTLLASALAAVAFLGVNALWWAWEGGMGWGPRLAAPVVVAAAPLVAWGARRWPRMALTLAAAGALLNLPGYLLDPGRIYADVAARSDTPRPLGPVVPIHRDAAGALYGVQRVHYEPARATWIVAPALLARASAVPPRAGDAALLRAMAGGPLLPPTPDAASLLLQEAGVTAGVEPARALRMSLRALSFGAPVPDAAAIGSYLALKLGDAPLAERLARRGLADDPTRPDLRSNLAAAQAATRPPPGE